MGLSHRGVRFYPRRHLYLKDNSKAGCARVVDDLFTAKRPHLQLIQMPLVMKIYCVVLRIRGLPSNPSVVSLLYTVCYANVLQAYCHIVSLDGSVLKVNESTFTKGLIYPYELILSTGK